MNFIKQYLLVFLACMLLAIVLAGCNTLNNKIDLMKSEHQLTCSPVDSSMCAGWKV